MEPISRHTILFLIISVLSSIRADGPNKYSKEMNQMKDGTSDEKPFRMFKINLLWEKAQKRLVPEKLKNLYSDLKLQDKDELTLKHLKAGGGDKEGLKEAELRKHFRAIMEKYDLVEHLEQIEETIRHRRMYKEGDETQTRHQDPSFNEASDAKIAKGLFKDKKLAKLWQKAERAGFTDDELSTLREELQHHQDKLEEYHLLMNDVNKFQDENYENSIDRFQSTQVEDGLKTKSKNLKEASQLLKEKHENLKQSHDRISKLTEGIMEGGFQEVKVQELWKLAKDAKFDPEELQSLKEELQHYEHRIKKLKHLQSQADFYGINEDKWVSDKHKPDDQKHLEQRIKQYGHKVNKVHGDLEARIMQRHLEL